MRAPLEDLRIISVEQYGAGPFGTMQLADLGADVIKIEDPRAGGDISRHVPPYQDGEHSLFFESFNRNKRSITLDLRLLEAQSFFRRLIKGADVVFSNLKPEKREKLLITYSDLKHVNPRIVCVSLSGFGSTGPRREEGAYDSTIQALAGWQSITGEPGGPPAKSGLSLVDFSSGYVAAIAILAGVHAARRDGVGRDVDLSLFETALAQLTYIGTWVASRNYQPMRRDHSSHQSIVPFQNFTAKDGWIVIACAKDTIWKQFCAAIGHRALADDERFRNFALRSQNREVLTALLNDILSKRTVSDWCSILSTAGVPAARVNSIEEALADPQAQARESIVQTSHPILGSIRHLRSPFHSMGGPEIQRGPFLGEHVADLVTELGVEDAERRQLSDSGIFGPAGDGDDRIELACPGQSNGEAGFSRTSKWVTFIKAGWAERSLKLTTRGLPS